MNNLMLVIVIRILKTFQKGDKIMLEKYKAKPGDEGYLDERGRSLYLICAIVCSILVIIVGYFFIKTL